MDNFIQLYNDQISTLTTKEIFAMWLKYNPITRYTTISKFTKQMKLYGFITKPMRLDNGIVRVYVRIAGTKPVTVVCWCGHSHQHAE